MDIAFKHIIFSNMARKNKLLDSITFTVCLMLSLHLRHASFISKKRILHHLLYTRVVCKSWAYSNPCSVLIYMVFHLRKESKDEYQKV